MILDDLFANATILYTTVKVIRLLCALPDRPRSPQVKRLLPINTIGNKCSGTWSIYNAAQVQ